MYDYKVKVLNGAGWRDHQVARIDVSLQNEKQVAQKLKATLEWAQHNFTDTYISLADTLQRHSYAAMYDVPVEKAMQYTKTEGEIWLGLHKDLIEGMRVVRWSEYLADPRFFENLKYMRDRYNWDAGWNALIINDAHDYMARRKLPDSKLPYVLDYILEEQAVFKMIHDESTIGIYAGSIMGSSKQSFCKIDFLRKRA